MELILTILVLALAYLSFRNYWSNNSTDDDDDDLDHLYED
nr:MAG TPA: FeoB-associated Cys-rich membrane protein [Caudoviricetes sp.]